MFAIAAYEKALEPKRPEILPGGHFDSREWARLELGGGPVVWPGAGTRFLSQVAGPHFETIY